MEANIINLTFPKSWSELTDKQLLFLFTLLADGYPATDIKVKCLLKWTGTKVIGCIEGKHLLRYRKQEFMVSAQQLAEAITFTDGTSSNLTIGDNLLVASLLGTANGIATLGSDGKVPAAQLPSYVDDVIEAASFVDFPAEGESGKIYVALDTNLTYRWSGSAYVEISASLALGETASTAYAGDKGKANAEALAALRAEFDEKVGAFTIGVNVPENAEFTDTKVTEVGNHYIPSKSATKSAAGATATAGATVQVVTGIEVDAAGHITGIVSGAVKDTVFDPSALNEAVVWNDVN